MNENSLRSQGFVGGMSTNSFMTKVLPMFSLGLLMTGVGAYFGWNLPSFVLMIAMLIEFIMVLTSSKWAYAERGSANAGIFLVFSTLSGMTLVPILKWALAVSGPGIIVQSLGATVLTFGGLAAYGMITKKDFSGMGSFLFMAVIGLIVASLINIFIGGTTLSLIISAISVVIFSAYVLYDMSMIRNNFSDRDFITASLILYLDFILLFQNILQILGIFNSDD
ncbi:MAG: Bax inhibitor-1/YccA family protein [Candidatus Sericytochromatia bacterium]